MTFEVDDGSFSCTHIFDFKGRERSRQILFVGKHQQSGSQKTLEIRDRGS